MTAPGIRIGQVELEAYTVDGENILEVAIDEWDGPGYMYDVLNEEQVLELLKWLQAMRAEGKL